MNPIDNNENYKFGIFYYNSDDPRTIVPRRHRMHGYTMNFARPISYVVFALLLILIVWLIYVLSKSSIPAEGLQF